MRSIRDSGAMPLPRIALETRALFGSAIVKLTAVCNIDCTYCYMFNQIDQSFRSAPKHMELATALASIDRVCEHIPLDRPFSIVLHGGEPTLWPADRWGPWFSRLAERRAQGYRIDVALQTNLVRPLGAELRRLLRENRVSLGISIDGPQAHNDAMRIDHRGRGTYARVMANVQALLDDGGADLIGGFLSVANPDIEPAAYLEWLRSLPVTRADVLWPIGCNWRMPPWGLTPRRQYAKRPRYGSWFARLFELWWELDDPGLQVRSFQDLVRLALGARSHGDMYVNDKLDMFVVETDGQYAYPDYLRNAGDNFARCGLGVETHSLDDLAREPGFAKLLRLGDHLPQACVGCRHEAVCGGGFLAGRAHPTEVVDRRPSVLCDDQMFFFDRALELVRGAIARRYAHEPRPFVMDATSS